MRTLFGLVKSACTVISSEVRITKKLICVFFVGGGGSLYWSYTHLNIQIIHNKMKYPGIGWIDRQSASISFTSPFIQLIQNTLSFFKAPLVLGLNQRWLWIVVLDEIHHERYMIFVNLLPEQFDALQVGTVMNPTKAQLYLPSTDAVTALKLSSIEVQITEMTATDISQQLTCHIPTCTTTLNFPTQYTIRIRGCSPSTSRVYTLRTGMYGDGIILTPQGNIGTLCKAQSAKYAEKIISTHCVAV
jgi:hypothetical protein